MKTKPSHHKQSGAVLLAFMLILITGTSYLLLNRLNNYTSNARDTETQMALLEAKKALLSYAMNYPELRNSTEKGPGFLPCPAQNETGDPALGCAVSTGTSLGRLPYKILGLSDLRESGSELLWYAVSDNFKNTLPNSTVLNSETPGLISVDSVNDIVAVIIAPGPPVAAQNTRPSINKLDYLEGINADSDASTFVTISTGEFNDRLITITRQELMAVVEQRVINEIRAVLANYYNDYGAYPWLAAFADPKADSRRLTGIHNGSSGSSNLTDTSTDFTDWNIQNGDLVINVSDGSVANVTGVTANTLSLGVLTLGTDNDFDVNDKYVVFKQNWSSNIFSGTAEGGSSGLTLIDTSKDFDELGILPGDIIENLSDTSGSTWSRGVIDTVSSTQLTAKSLSGGTVNVFASGNSYVIRTNTGRVTGASSTNLVDTSKDFTAMGVQAGDLVINLTDGSMTSVSSVTNSSTLALNTLYFGTENAFDTNDYYYLPRYNTNSNTREGLLAFHEAGKHFPSTFNIDWDPASVNAVDDVGMDSAFTGTQATYQAALQTFLTNYASTPLSDFIDLNEGVCRWLTEAIADCYFYYPPENINISGTVTSGSNTSVLTDSNADFVTDGVKRGDIVQNFDDEYALSPPVSGTADRGGATGTATGGSNNLLLEDTSKDFINLGVLIGDTITNTTDGSVGTISSVSASNVSVTSLTGGTNNVFTTGDNYNISGNAVLYDASTDFNAAGIVPYQYLVYNNTTGIRATITEVIDSNTIKAVAFDNQASPIIFTTGNTYTVYTPGIVVVTDVPSSTVANTTRASIYNPDFDLLAGPYPEYYRILTAADSFSSAATGASGITLTDTARNFISEGVVIGDIIENVTDGSSFGAITNVTANTITATLYGGILNTFNISDNYILYHNYVYSRRAEWHTRFNGNMITKSLSNKRVRDVCLGYDVNCSTTSATAFSGNGSVPLITIRDYAKNGVTEVGRATFTPSSSSTGSIRVANIDYYLHEANDELPDWFIKNRWHQLIYVAYSADYVPGGANDCETPVNNCLTLKVQRPYGTEVNNTRKALVMAASKELEDNVTCVVSGNVTKSGEGTLLINSDAAFKKDSIIPGDTVLNLIDGSTAQVVSVDSDTEITTTALVGGTSNKWNLSNVYQFSKTEKQDRAMAKLSSYYEFENCNRGNDEFDKSNITDSFNDQISVIDP